jgi:hypothetical protein
VIKPPSLVADYTLIYSGDPALNLPADDAERERVLELARETGNWRDLLIEGDPPTLFQMRPLPGSVYDYWCGEVRRRELVDREAAALLFRLALTKIDNFGKLVVEHIKVDGHRIAKVDTLDQIYAALGGTGSLVVAELANHVLHRSEPALRPKP